MQQPGDPIHDTPRERMVKEGQCLRNGQYTQNFGEETSLEKAYDCAQCYKAGYR